MRRNSRDHSTTGHQSSCDLAPTPESTQPSLEKYNENNGDLPEDHPLMERSSMIYEIMLLLVNALVPHVFDKMT